MKESYGTLSETINGLKRAGYTMDFNILEECVVCQAVNISLSPDEFEIDKTYRFEGESNPDDEAIVYAISSDIHGVKGVLVNSYGVYADPVASKLVKKLNKRGKHD